MGAGCLPESGEVALAPEGLTDRPPCRDISEFFIVCPKIIRHFDTPFACAAYSAEAIFLRGSAVLSKSFSSIEANHARMKYITAVTISGKNAS